MRTAGGGPWPALSKERGSSLPLCCRSRTRRRAALAQQVLDLRIYQRLGLAVPEDAAVDVEDEMPFGTPWMP